MVLNQRAVAGYARTRAPVRVMGFSQGGSVGYTWGFSTEKGRDVVYPPNTRFQERILEVLKVDIPNTPIRVIGFSRNLGVATREVRVAHV